MWGDTMANETEAKGSGIFAILKQSVKEFVDDDAPTMAAATRQAAAGRPQRRATATPPLRDPARRCGRLADAVATG